MSYASNQNVIDRLGNALAAQLTTESSSTVPDAAQITEARETAEAEVNSYVGRRYAVPVDTAVDATTAAMLKGATITIAAYRCHQHKPPVPEDVTKAYEATVVWLNRVAKGEAVLPSAVALASPTAEGPSGTVDGRDRLDWHAI